MTSSFPPPPSYYEEYTAHAVASGTCPPPPLIPTGAYRNFGAISVHDAPLLLPLAEQGIEQLYSAEGNVDHAGELRALNQRLTILFMRMLDELVTGSTHEDTVATTTAVEAAAAATASGGGGGGASASATTAAADVAAAAAAPLKEIELVLVNMFHLLNEFRPHQGREYIRAMLEDQHLKYQTLTTELGRTLGTIETQLQDCLKLLTEPPPATAAANEAAAAAAAAALKVSESNEANAASTLAQAAVRAAWATDKNVIEARWRDEFVMAEAGAAKV